ncbi:MAG: YVTN family beta-propeller protein [Thalassomonas sp.]|jgi:YVTN family beta-propeller protein
MKKNLRKIGMFALAITVLSSCKKDNIDDIYVAGNYEDGYFVTNEGNFGTGNGSISFVDEYGAVENDVFASINSFALGDVVQSMNIIGSRAYILVNGSSKIEVASVDSMYSVATIDAVSPRYIAKVNDNKAYVTDWGINGVQVIDLLTNTISSTIACGTGPEGITVANGFAYVCNVGGWGLDNTVSVINTTTDAVETTLIVGDKPNSVVVDVNGAVWVLTGGFTEYDDDWNVVSETAGNLVKIVNNTIEETYAFALGNHPQDLVIDDAGTTLYYSDGSWSKAVYAFDVNDTELPTTALIDKSFYGLGVHGGYVYGTDAVDFTQSGWSYKYTADGTIIDSVQVGIIPGGYCFN